MDASLLHDDPMHYRSVFWTERTSASVTRSLRSSLSMQEGESIAVSMDYQILRSLLTLMAQTRVILRLLHDLWGSTKVHLQTRTSMFWSKLRSDRGLQLESWESHDSQRSASGCNADEQEKQVSSLPKPSVNECLRKRCTDFMLQSCTAPLLSLSSTYQG